jgi:3-oxoacyl-[acyl-carrier-protein] synthase II
MRILLHTVSIQSLLALLIRIAPPSLMTQERRVVITGLGAVAPNGIGRTAFWHSLTTGISGIRRISFFDTSTLATQVAGTIPHFDPLAYMPKHLAHSTARFSQLALAATALAVRDAQLPDHLASLYPTTAVCCGSSANATADLAEPAHRRFVLERATPLPSAAPLELPAHAATAHMSQLLGTTGPLSTLSSGCSTGLDVVAWGLAHIRHSLTDLAIVAATEAPISEFSLALFDTAGFTSRWKGPPHAASRPYDLLRSGLVLAEGAGALVLEELEHALARSAPIYAELLGYGSASEAGLPSRRRLTYARGLELAARAALHCSHLSPSAVDYVSAHGNSTRDDDAADTAAYKAIFGDRAYNVPISSIKSSIGQPFSAAGILQVVATALAIQHQTVPPTINLTHPDPDCDLDYVPNRSRSVRLNVAMIHAHSLGAPVPGSHTALLIQRPNLPPHAA